MLVFGIIVELKCKKELVVSIKHQHHLSFIRHKNNKKRKYIFIYLK